MEIPIDVLVKCRDGRCGYCLQILLNPVTHRIMYLVVRENDLPGTERLVPIDWILETTPSVIHLRCTKAQFATLDKVLEQGRDQLSMPIYANTPSDSALPYPDPEALLRPVKQEHLLFGVLAISPSTHVQTTDGESGRLEEFLIDPQYGRITHLVMWQGRPGRGRQVLIPGSQIERIEEHVIRLKVNRQAIDALPATPWEKKSPE